MMNIEEALEFDFSIIQDVRIEKLIKFLCVTTCETHERLQEVEDRFKVVQAALREHMCKCSNDQIKTDSHECIIKSLYKYEDKQDAGAYIGLDGIVIQESGAIISGGTSKEIRT